jgi:dolichyl-phosphate beta-glucosyltransferase
MPLQPELSIVIPAYNEQARLEPTLWTYLQYFRSRKETFELIVVDDGSLDATTLIVERIASTAPEVRLMRLAENRG